MARVLYFYADAHFRNETTPDGFIRTFEQIMATVRQTDKPYVQVRFETDGWHIFQGNTPEEVGVLLSQEATD